MAACRSYLYVPVRPRFMSLRTRMRARTAQRPTSTLHRRMLGLLVLGLSDWMCFSRRGPTVSAFSRHMFPLLSPRTATARRLNSGPSLLDPLHRPNKTVSTKDGQHVLPFSSLRTNTSFIQAIRPKRPSKSLEEHPFTYNHHHNLHVHLTTTTLRQLILISASTLAILSGVVALCFCSGPGSWRYYVAGGICAATSHAITTPIDVVKTKKQLDSRLLNLSTPEATMTIAREEGASALLAGLGPTALGYLLEGSVKYGVYEVLKPVMRRFLQQAAMATNLAALQSQLLAFVLCGIASGVAASLLLCPMEALRIRLVAEPDFAPKGWIQGGYRMLRNEGIVGLFKGMTPMLYKQVPYTVTKNVSFDVMTRGFYGLLRNAGYTIGGSVKVAVPLVAAMLASVLSAISSQPGDVLLSLVNAHEGDKRTNRFLKEIYESKDGLMKGLFVGMKARFLHVGVIVTIQLLIYDVVKRLCGIAATGTV